MDLLDVESELRSHLTTRPAPRAPEGLVERTRVLHRRRRRHQAAVAGAGLAVALLFGSVPVLRAALPDVGTADDAAAPPRVATQSLYELPTRGSLAGDAAWLQGVAALPWRADELEEGTSPPVGSHRVTWAGDVAGSRVALVLGDQDGRLSGTWFTGPAGAEPGGMTQATGAYRVLRNQPLTLVDAPDGGASGLLVVVGLPGDTVEYVAGTTVTAAGTEQVDRRQLPGADGAAAGAIGDPRALAGRPRVAVLRGGQELSSMSYALTDRAEAFVQAPVEPLADPRGLRGRVSEELLQSTLRSAVSLYGIDTDVSTPVLLAAAPSSDGQGGTVLVGLTFPSGATLLSVGSSAVTSDQSSVSTHTGTQPAGTPLPDQVLAVPLGGRVALSGPADAVSAELLGADGAPLATVPLSAGSGVGTTGSTATAARFRGADGTVLAEVGVRELGS
ncbi:hypothetical protein [Modestobacter versicolor]|uniref:Uncharacterized protein n=1 Tax=Modestobacter versicolor TaxID=429133 RepID=A0A323VD01_9ACTN|nr:hypothetical protein [Modestobacter versicolor]MBB3677470.1 hypothetical protein [Modestobacter versicolor]PZA22585.1 hypothetical protein DMO24_04325 [Modestobacter versicolor]